MTDPTRIRAVVKRALLREAAQNLGTGQRLYGGRWLDADSYRRARRAGRWAGLRATLEALVVCALVALAGLGFMVVVLAVL